MKDNEKSETLSDVNGVIDFIQLVFRTDLGEGHLKSFDQAKSLDLNFEFSIDLNSDITPIYIETPTCLVVKQDISYLQIKNTDDIPIIKQHLLSNIDFRGPPILA